MTTSEIQKRVHKGLVPGKLYKFKRLTDPINRKLYSWSGVSAYFKLDHAEQAEFRLVSDFITGAEAVLLYVGLGCVLDKAEKNKERSWPAFIMPDGEIGICDNFVVKDPLDFLEEAIKRV